MKKTAFALVLSAALCAMNSAQSPPQPPREALQTPASATVVSVENANGHDKNAAHLTDRILVKVRNLDELLKPDKKADSVILYLDGRPLENTKAEPVGPPINGETVLAFDLRPDYSRSDEAEAWRRIRISARRADPDQVRISVGLPAQAPIESREFLLLKRPPFGYQLAVYCGLGLLVFSVILLANKSNLIRTGPASSGGAKPRFSLGQTQMAIWFCLVVIGWAYISLMTISAAHISSSILVLIGISSATGLAAVTMDVTKPVRSAESTEVGKLREELDGTPDNPGLRSKVLNARAALAIHEAQLITTSSRGGSATQSALASVPANLAALEIALAEKEVRLRELAGKGSQAPAVSRNWLADILSDENGISFHRFQMFVWTVVLGSYFLVSVFKDYLMPEIDTQLLTVMGISSGTYLGFKYPEARRT